MSSQSKNAKLPILPYQANVTVPMVAGTTTVTGVSIRDSSEVDLQHEVYGAGANGFLREDRAARVPETAPGAGDGSFVIESSAATDIATVRWIIWNLPFESP